MNDVGMTDQRRGSRQRCLLVWVAATSTLGALLSWLLGDLAAGQAALTGPGIGAQPFDQTLVWVCSAAALACGAWLWTLTTVVVLEATLGSRRPGIPGVPTAVRRFVLVACGVAIFGVAVPAVATPGSPHPDHTGRKGQTIVAGLPLPDRATGEQVHVQAQTQVQALSRAVVVQPGDTFWAIAQADVGVTASNATIATHWQRIYALNRAVVGADPNIIRPGQRLRLPPIPA